LLSQHVIFLLGCYFLGSIPFGFLIVYFTAKKDIRTLGSQSTGATNVLRNMGKAAALATLLLDVGKGALAVAYAKSHFPSPMWMVVGGALVIIGHIYPVFLKFKGGKGVASFLGVFLVFYYPAVLVFLGSWLVVVAFTRFVSMGSLTAVIALFFSILFTQPAEIAAVVLVIAVLVIAKHRSNIDRLRSGTENKLDLRKKKHDGQA